MRVERDRPSFTRYGFNATAMYVSLQLFNQRELPALFLATGAALVWSCAVSKLLVFRKGGI